MFSPFFRFLFFNFPFLRSLRSFVAIQNCRKRTQRTQRKRLPLRTRCLSQPIRALSWLMMYFLISNL
jgi:hypothetical protein